VARLLTAGAELKDGGSTGLEAPTTGGAEIDTEHIRYKGVASYKMLSGYYWEKYLATSVGIAQNKTVYVRMYARMSELPKVTSPFGCALASGPFIGPWLNTAGELKLGRTKEGTRGSEFLNMGSGSKTLEAGKWYRIEVAYEFGSTANHVESMALRVNGETIATTSESCTGNETLYFGGLWETGYVNLDDIAVNNSEGSKQNSWPGPGYVLAVMPASDGSRTGFTTGAAGTTNLYKAVGNRPPIGKASGSTTAESQIERESANTTDNYTANLQTYAEAGLGANDKVMVAQTVLSHGNSTTTAISMSLTATNPTIAEQTFAGKAEAAGTYPTGWVNQQGTVVYPEEHITSTPTLEVIKKTSSSSVYGYVALMALIVECQEGETFSGALFGTFGIIGSISGHKVAEATLAQAEGVVADLTSHKMAKGSLVSQEATVGSLVGRKQASGSLTGQVGLTGSSSGGKTASGGLTSLVGSTGSLAGHKTAMGSLWSQSGARDVFSGRKTAAGSLSGLVGLSGSLVGAKHAMGSVSGMVGFANLLAGNKASGEVYEGALLNELGLLTGIRGSKTARGSLNQTLATHGTLMGSKTTYGALTESLGVSGALLGRKVVTGSLHGTLGLEPEIGGSKTTSGSLSLSLAFTCLISGTTSHALPHVCLPTSAEITQITTTATVEPTASSATIGQRSTTTVLVSYTTTATVEPITTSMETFC
jgi:hypothetical protein